ncbi:MAG: hypothetical protein ACK5JI_08760 [Azonexus sp.]
MATVGSVSTAGWLPPLTRAASREKAAPALESTVAVVDISGKGKLLQALQESDLAHLPLLGEMKRMSGTG